MKKVCVTLYAHCSAHTGEKIIIWTLRDEVQVRVVSLQAYNHAYRRVIHIYARALVFLSKHTISAYLHLQPLFNKLFLEL